MEKLHQRTSSFNTKSCFLNELKAKQHDNFFNRQVAKAYIEAVKSSNRLTPKPLGAVIAMHEDDILEQAKASTVRYSTKTMLGPIDGVMMLVKDEVSCIKKKNT